MFQTPVRTMALAPKSVVINGNMPSSFNRQLTIVNAQKKQPAKSNDVNIVDLTDEEDKKKGTK